MSDPNQDIVHRLLHWAYTICTFNKAQVARDAAAEIERLRAELAAAIKQRNGYRSALERIANEDYRGNRSKESQIAFDALAAADAARTAMRKGASDGK